MEELRIKYRIESIASLSASDLLLVEKAREATGKSYAPYSKFHVGCSLLMDGGDIVQGANQENIAYPQCVCAEVSGLNTAAMTKPGVVIQKIFIASEPVINSVLSPCGQCRQTILEYERKQNSDIEIGLLQGEQIYLFKSIKDLLPFAF